MAYTLGEAAKACGMSKAGIAKALANNKVSATKDAFGRWQIDPAELHRVYPSKFSNVDGGAPQANAEVARLKAVVDVLERLCRQVEGERDNLREQNTRLTALLTDQSQQAPKRKGWFTHW
ncbi:MAG: hypothetical protein JOZ45_23210 [Acidobacteriaceae bacterium]|nr:hypothetical protein [Acidobacteriaceae bacterium]MBV9940011.1 hypothetical protein [Acidobacteriaceae bacterium]